MRHLLVTLTLLLSLSGCQEKDQLDQEAQAKHDAKIAAQAGAELLTELEAAKKAQGKTVESKILLQEKETETKPEDNKTKLDQMGVTMDDGTIIIDTNKTKDFFNELSKKMDVQMKKIGHDLEKGIIETKEAGIEIKDNHINIDLNKTQDLLEDWGKKIQVFAKEFDDIAKSLDKNNTRKEFNATN